MAVAVAALSLTGWLAWNPACADATSTAQQVGLGAQSLALLPPHTDGADLGQSPPSLGPLERLQRLRAAKRACQGPCEIPFGARLGTADGVEARSNCSSACLRLEYSFVDPTTGEVQVADKSPDADRFEYAGVTYQCVEYARRWWIRNRSLTFGDVPTAADIFDLTAGLRLPGREPVPLGRSLNGAGKRAPQRGDLVIYARDHADPEWRFGHVAVVVGVNLKQGWVELAEENYDNLPWRDPEAYARRIRLFAVGGRYTLIDVEPGRTRHPGGGQIVGWLYPLAEP
ncbi:CHAP domain-containing protein [Thiorhodococcus mannitoliphagus]|uniref:CHAP domain-containing protein n=2 Tax=Thiorhodococcus mannitoliphagus TaxID=329406 RepID=A0A6P1DSP1_9GAMM|nr:CHAP domain-containing protein [Thiorhodococcus mannitoliphagus]